MKAILISLVLIATFIIPQSVFALHPNEKIHVWSDNNLIKEHIKYSKKKPYLDEIIEGVPDTLGTNFSNKEKLRQIDEIFKRTIKEYKRELALVPVRRIVKQPKGHISNLFKAFGYKMLLPWEKESSRYHSELISYIVKHGSWIVVVENPKDGFWSGAYESWKYDAWFDFIYYDIPSDSLFGFTKSVLSVNSVDLYLLQDELEIYKKMSQIILGSKIKWVFTSKSKKHGRYVDSIYSFDLPNVKGFQIGKPDTSKLTHLILFPKKNIELNIEIFKGENGNITQDHIDQIIRTFLPDSKN